MSLLNELLEIFLQNVILFVTFFSHQKLIRVVLSFLSEFAHSLFCPLKHHCAAATDVTLHSWPEKGKSPPKS
jgi:hypothetical protein